MRAVHSCNSWFFTSSGRLFNIKRPEYLRLCLKHSVLGLGGTKQPAAGDRKITELLSLLHSEKFSEIYSGAILLL